MSRSLILIALLLQACAGSPTEAVSALRLPSATSQVVLVTTSGWRAAAATLRRLERTPAGWRVVGPAIPACVGRNGLGWGLGEHVDGPGPKKREGDGRGPAGVFQLGTAFGYSPSPPAGLRVPYRQATPRDYFVDAVGSPDYNQWRHIPAGQANDPGARWESAERMRRDDDLYALGMVVAHNPPPAVAGRGSAIFLHVWRGPGSPTSGCTSISRADLLQVLTWLRPDARPLLVQAPWSALRGLRF